MSESLELWAKCLDQLKTDINDEDNIVPLEEGACESECSKFESD